MKQSSITLILISIIFLASGCSGLPVKNPETTAAVIEPITKASASKKGELATATPDFIEPRTPLNTKESAARYGLMSEREQLSCYPWGMLTQRAEVPRWDTVGPFAYSNYTAEQQEAARRYVLDGFEKAGIALPDDARIATDTAGFQDSFDLAQPDGSSLPAKVYIAVLITDAAADEDDPFKTTVAVALELMEDGKEELIVFIYPEMSNTLVDAELHVFSEQDGVLKEILTFIGDSPERSSLTLPDDYRPLTPAQMRAGFRAGART